MTKVMKAEVDRNGNSRKVMEKKYSNLQPPPPKNNWGGVQFFFSNEKNQIGSKLPEMARKLVENYFVSFLKLKEIPQEISKMN